MTSASRAVFVRRELFDIVAFITQSAVIDQILMRLRTRADSGIRPWGAQPTLDRRVLGLATAT